MNETRILQVIPADGDWEAMIEKNDVTTPLRVVAWALVEHDQQSIYEPERTVEGLVNGGPKGLILASEAGTMQGYGHRRRCGVAQSKWVRSLAAEIGQGMEAAKAQEARTVAETADALPHEVTMAVVGEFAQKVIRRNAMFLDFYGVRLREMRGYDDEFPSGEYFADVLSAVAYNTK